MTLLWIKYLTVVECWANCNMNECLIVCLFLSVCVGESAGLLLTCRYITPLAGSFSMFVPLVQTFGDKDLNNCLKIVWMSWFLMVHFIKHFLLELKSGKCFFCWPQSPEEDEIESSVKKLESGDVFKHKRAWAVHSKGMWPSIWYYNVYWYGFVNILNLYHLSHQVLHKKGR